MDRMNGKKNITWLMSEAYKNNKRPSKRKEIVCFIYFRKKDKGKR